MIKSTVLILATIVLIVTIASLGQAQQRSGSASSEDAFILIEATTYRIGTTQTAEATVSVRTAKNPRVKLGVEVMTCQITKPVTGEKINGRRVTETKCSASWPIDSDSDEAMKDFDVTATASSAGIGDLETTQTFKYKEMKSKNRRTPKIVQGSKKKT